MKIKIKDKILKEIGNIADSNNIEIFIVGGYVRDYILNRERTDFDITVIGDSIKFAKLIAKEFNSKAVIYKKFRTAMVPTGGYYLEFVGTRKEKYLPDSRKPIVSEGSLQEDLKRRDFTVNALAASLNKKSTGEIIDMFDGLGDIKKKILRTPLDPEKTYSDDPLRMMRAARFASQLGFDLDPASFNAISKMAERIKIISQERISAEFIKILDSPDPGAGITILFESGLLKYIFPELEKLAGVEIVREGNRNYGHKDVLRHSIKVLNNLASRSDKTWLRFAALTHDIAKPATKRFSSGNGWSFHGHEELGAKWMRKIFRRMKFPMDELPYVEKLVRLHQRPMVLVDDTITDSAVRRLAVTAGDALEDLFILCRADITTKNPNRSKRYFYNYDKVAQKVIDVQEKDRLREFQSPVRGEEIMEICNLEPSRAVGYIKTQIEEAILDGIIPNKYEEAKKYFLENKDHWLSEIRSAED